MLCKQTFYLTMSAESKVVPFQGCLLAKPFTVFFLADASVEEAQERET